MLIEANKRYRRARERVEEIATNWGEGRNTEAMLAETETAAALKELDRIVLEELKDV